MEKFKVITRYFLLAILIILACFGIGMGNAAPPHSNFKREDKASSQIELVENKEESEEEKLAKY